MKEEVPGVKIDEEYINRMKNTKDPKEEGVKIAVETIQALKSLKGIHGVHLMPMMWESITPILVEEAGLKTIS
jgi:methylenetetrahydrofolate reductase (NADPH)